ncbi:MAG: hypothetical protein E4G98_00385 [Promethearchaeota archaeon]|nr:MAG: hypothetical protein E4G98_00385 [Candidatus Lokiarchaeota archaeon]
MRYETKYVRVSKVKDLFAEDDKKIRIAGDAKDLVHEYFDKAVAAAAKELIDKLPRKSKGTSKGELKRITIQKDDFE